MIFSTSCAGCRQPGEQLCRRCRFSLAAAARPAVRPGPHGEQIAAALRFEGVTKSLITALKYRNRRAAAGVLARQVVQRVRPDAVDLVTWAPTSASRAGRRGFDQAELLARAVARQLEVPCRRLLYRQHAAGIDGPQTGKRRWERLLGPQFRARPGLAHQRVLLIDDVVTTGATLAGAAAALRGAGVLSVQAVAVAVADQPASATRSAARNATRAAATAA